MRGINDDGLMFPRPNQCPMSAPRRAVHCLAGCLWGCRKALALSEWGAPIRLPVHSRM